MSNSNGGDIPNFDVDVSRNESKYVMMQAAVGYNATSTHWAKKQFKM